MKKYIVTDNYGKILKHRICSEPKDIFFPAIFDEYESACDYANGIGIVKKCNININKTILFDGDYYR